MSQIISNLAQQYGISETAVAGIYHAGKTAGRSERITARPNAGDLHEQLSLDCYRLAYDAGMSLSAWLEEQDPGAEYHDGLDAFQRQLAIADIRTRSDHRLGVWAHSVERFWKATPTSAVLFPEFVAREWRAATAAPYELQRFYLSTAPASDILLPSYVETELRARRLAPSILNDLIAVRTGIDRATYQAFYLTESAADERMVRVGEHGPFPTAKLSGGDHTIRLKKYGRALEITYEAVRQMSIDLFGFHLRRLALRADKDKAQAAIKVAVDGDGNGNAVDADLGYEHDISTLEGGTANQIDLKPWLHFGMQFEEPYAPNVVVAQSPGVLELLTLDAGTNNWMIYMALLQQAALGGLTLPEAPWGAFRVYARSYAETKKVIAIDNRFALEMVYEIGANLVETDKLIQAQFSVIVLSEVIGFAKLDDEAVRVLDWGN